MNPNQHKNKWIWGLLFVGIILVIWFAFVQLRAGLGSNGDVAPGIQTVDLIPVDSEENESLPDISVIAENLAIPWDIAFLPEGGMLVTERAGDLLLLGEEGTTKTTIPLAHPVPKGEGGLLGIVLHPDFASNRLLYLYMTTAQEKTETKNTVFRYEFRDGKLSNEKVIVKDIPGAIYHDGGRMEFGPDGMLYITTGDAQSPNIAQNLSSLGGKILRVNDDGTIPSDNPFKTAVYSYGHRNPQGLAWDSAGNLWETEHGRSGVTSGLDEINLIRKGKNYGWPTIEGDAVKTGMEKPAKHSGARVTWAPASLIYYDGSLFFGGLRGEALYEAILENNAVKEVKAHFFEEYGRIRTVRIGPLGMFYLTTSNRDGRGSPEDTDDRIIRVNPEIFRR